MAGASLLTLLDDIATILDDVAVMSKVAVKKTAGVLGDDLALNAEQVSGVRAERELPVVWAVSVGSLKNKLILVPLALIISQLAPWAVKPLLMLGGLFLCFEGCEKLYHSFFHDHHDDEEHNKHLKALADPQADLVAIERDKIRGAIRTDFVLSAEIIVITLGTVAAESFGKRLAVLCAIAMIMTVGVYGLVAAIVKLDDVGLFLSKPTESGTSRGKQALGRFILWFAPFLMRFLSIAGTFAMFSVGGHILTEGIPPIHHFIEHAAEVVHALPGVGGVFAFIVSMLLDALVGIVAGAITLLLFKGFLALKNRGSTPGQPGADAAGH